MLRTRLLQTTRRQINVLSRPSVLRNTHFPNTIKNITTKATCIALPQQQAYSSLTLWKATTLVAATALTYGIVNTNVYALEANDGRFFFLVFETKYIS